PQVFGGDHAKRFETSMLLRIGRDWNVDLVDLSRFEKSIEKVPTYQINDKEIPIREPELWDWTDQDLTDENVCSAVFGEKLIAAISAGLALEILELLGELGIDYNPPKPITFPSM
ncbi:MAG: hypothetical protein ACTSRA_23395, partial [Promethearchaeota archaeon]